MGPIIKADMEHTRTAGIIADQRGIIVGWLGKLLIGFVVVGVVIFDAGSILVNFFTLDSTADEIAITLSTGLASGGGFTERELEEEANALAEAAGAKLISVAHDPDNNLVFVSLERTADTLVVERLGWIDQWGEAHAEGQAGTG
jgi:hypothetical protein